MKATHISCVQEPYRPSHKNYKESYKNHIKLIEVAGWLLILITLLIFMPPVKADTMSPADTISPSAVNWTYNWSFTATFDSLTETSDHINFTGIQNWDRSQIIVGEDNDFDLLTKSDYNHNITMTNLSDTYTRIDLDLNGNTSINISDMVSNTEYNILHNGVQNKTVTTDSNGYLFFYENFSGTVEIEISEFTGTPGITNQYNNYTADSSTNIIVERLNGVEFQATANQTIDEWYCYNSTYVSGNGSDTGECERYFDTNGDYTTKMRGSNDQGTTENATWIITVEDTTPPNSVSNLDQTDTTLTSITWAWDNPHNDDHNHSIIYYRKDGGSWSHWGNVSNTTTSVEITGLNDGTTYEIMIPTCDYYGNCQSNTSATSDAASTDTSGGGGGGGFNQAPTADFSHNKVSQYKVNFTDKSSDLENNLQDWSWSFGDGGTSGLQSPSHTYNSFGTYTVTLTVKDGVGLTDSHSEDIIIQKVIVKPTATTTAPSAPNYYNNLTDVIGGDNIDNGTATNPNTTSSFQDFAATMALPYVGLMGSLFFAYAFFLPYLMMWLRQENAMIATVIGIILGVTVMLAFAPAQFRLIVMAIIALILTGRIYLWMRGRA